MLEYLFFRIGGYFQGSRVVIIRNHNGRLSLDCLRLLCGSRASFPHFHAEWTKQRSKRWSSKFAALRCEEWEDRYYEYILDGTQWELRYKFEGQDERLISGSNAYPENWGSFMTWVAGVVRSLPRVEDATWEDVVREERIQ